MRTDPKEKWKQGNKKMVRVPSCLQYRKLLLPSKFRIKHSLQSVTLRDTVGSPIHSSVLSSDAYNQGKHTWKENLQGTHCIDKSIQK